MPESSLQGGQCPVAIRSPVHGNALVSGFTALSTTSSCQPESTYLTMDPATEGPMESLLGHSITYRIATGPRQGRKVLTLQTLPAIDEPFTTRAGNVAGFSLHAGVATKADERDKLERLCRYITRPAISEKRLSLTEHGQVRYTLKTPWRDGTTHVIFEPLDFMARLAALTPKPRVNLTRFHGVFAPNSKHRALITPAGRGKGRKLKPFDEPQDRTPVERHPKRVCSADSRTMLLLLVEATGYWLAWRQEGTPEMEHEGEVQACAAVSGDVLVCSR